MSKALFAGLAAAALLATPAAAADDGAQPEKLLCKREQRVGTRLAQRVCLTRAQWRQREIAQQELSRRMKDNADREVRDRMLPGTPTNGG